MPKSKANADLMKLGNSPVIYTIFI